MTKEKNQLISTILKSSDSKYCQLISESNFFDEQETIPTDVPILNAALTADITKGLSSGILTIAGQSKRFKTLFGLYLIAAFQKKYSSGVCIFYDSEFGTPPDYLTKFGLDLTRIVHIPIKCVEDLKHDMTKLLDTLNNDENKDKNNVMIFIDSLGSLASRKELEDALEGKEKADMTRAKTIRSLFRIIRLDIKMLRIPLVIVSHTYKDQGAANPRYAGEIVGGGEGGVYGSDDVWLITRSQEKEEDDIVGYKFNITAVKSRSVKEKSRFSINVYWKDGVHKFSGLSELALEFGIIERTKLEGVKGKPFGLKFKELEIDERIEDNDKDFWEYVINNSDLKQKIIDKYKI